jgi:hypothetical protein
VLDSSRKRKLVLMIIIGLFAAIQFYPVERTNPPVRQDLGAPPGVTEVLHSSCYDCHSNETRWPWYSRIAPASWLLVDHVNEARGEVNFSEWDSVSPGKHEEILEEIWEKVEEGEMPLLSYKILHPEARLSPERLAVLRDWIFPEMQGETTSGKVTEE